MRMDLLINNLFLYYLSDIWHSIRDNFNVYIAIVKPAYLQFSLKEKENSQICPQEVNIEIRTLCTITTVCAPPPVSIFHAQQVK